MEIAPYVAGECEPHAVVREEDVQLVLVAARDPRPPRESLRELERAAVEAAGHAPGSVIVRPGRPLCLLAIVHDVDHEPSWREDWIVDAARAAFVEAHRRGLTRIATPLLGTVHGRLTPGRAAELLAAVLAHPGVEPPERLWIEDADPETVDWLRRRLA